MLIAFIGWAGWKKGFYHICFNCIISCYVSSIMPIQPVNSKLLGVALLNLEMFILTFFIFVRLHIKCMIF